MFPDLPEHLQALNTIPGNSPHSSGMNPEQEEAFWGFLHADELFRNFGSVPSPHDEEKKQQQAAQNQMSAPAAPAPTPTTVATPISSSSKDDKHSRPTLESFLAAYMGNSSTTAQQQSAAQTISNYLMPLPSPYTNPASNAQHQNAIVPSTSVTTQDVVPSASTISAYEDSPIDDKPSGAKKLKQMGANPNDIEEDKRRRNTEASARFRAKKKEREQALERRAKELEAQVASLTAENSSLQNENRLLKAIVLNGSNPGAAALAGVIGTGHDTQGQDALQAALAALGKRKRDE
ncbi:regulatory protein Cys-3 [Cryptococcus gattii E566]|uniref:Regulatory protein cys-3, putative n=2 Tax=Cryptococcus gattii TaxID=37769 RepID=E6RC92_CRYGW|nr:regulatory protein cys-3, putative [Cryptococcus gattii WM276]ADV24459.1 regulatory protein cys-3, putative [Cryptococcus gattii WM276]KIR76236.1 regulatory protein Cys-3 [Cryptococcus gattii EJB2]KIY32527.1 regulatory protein Cys-3 [Cryptococcus gattii E566]KJE02334.1 regulatory protein Cys-3 [Cryptococcus gattii NT-10]